MNKVFGGANGRKSKEVVESSTDCGNSHRGSVKPVLKSDRVGWQARESSFTALTAPAWPLLGQEGSRAIRAIP